jgi:hypothetical protein
VGDEKINVNMGVKKMVWEDVDLIHVAQDRVQWLALVNTVMNLLFP